MTPRPPLPRSPDHTDVEGAYDRVADEYVRRIFHELDQKPFDRQVLDRFADRARGRGPIYELGCGPGHVARYLHARGVDVIGLDLSGAMVKRARELSPGIEFRRGDLRALDVADGRLAGIVAFYSIIHIAPASLAAVFTEFHRALAPGAPLLLAFHVGDEAIHLDEWWGSPVALDIFFFDPGHVTMALEATGLLVVEALQRAPYPGVEHQSRRAYILAERGSGGRERGDPGPLTARS
jgi:SAM-dependent methyltransferase